MSQKSKARRRQREVKQAQTAHRVIIGIISALIILGMVFCAFLFN